MCTYNITTHRCTHTLKIWQLCPKAKDAGIVKDLKDLPYPRRLEEYEQDLLKCIKEGTTKDDRGDCADCIVALDRDEENKSAEGVASAINRTARDVPKKERSILIKSEGSRRERTADHTQGRIKDHGMANNHHLAQDKSIQQKQVISRKPLPTTGGFNYASDSHDLAWAAMYVGNTLPAEGGAGPQMAVPPAKTTTKGEPWQSARSRQKVLGNSEPTSAELRWQSQAAQATRTESTHSKRREAAQNPVKYKTFNRDVSLDPPKELPAGQSYQAYNRDRVKYTPRELQHQTGQKHPDLKKLNEEVDLHIHNVPRSEPQVRLKHNNPLTSIWRKGLEKPAATSAAWRNLANSVPRQGGQRIQSRGAYQTPLERVDPRLTANSGDRAVGERGAWGRKSKHVVQNQGISEAEMHERNPPRQKGNSQLPVGKHWGSRDNRGVENPRSAMKPKESPKAIEPKNLKEAKKQMVPKKLKTPKIPKEFKQSDNNKNSKCAIM